jgi:uncharacterized protein (DUF4415 family)
MSKIVRKTLSEVLRDTPEKRRIRERFAKLPDRKIDLSDIPELTDEFWQNAARNPADVIAWLRQKGRGYQTRTNALLRELMLKDVGGKKKAS